MSACIDVLSPSQRRMLADLAHGIGFKACSLTDYWGHGNLAIYNQERTVRSLERRGLIDGDQLTTSGHAALAMVAAGGDA